jgi:hypothetical protein
MSCFVIVSFIAFSFRTIRIHIREKRILQERWVHFERYPRLTLPSLLLLLLRIVSIDVAFIVTEVCHPSGRIREVEKRILPPQVVNVFDRSSYLAWRCKCGHSYCKNLKLGKLLCLSGVLGNGLGSSPTITTAVALRGFARCILVVHDGVDG